MLSVPLLLWTGLYFGLTIPSTPVAQTIDLATEGAERPVLHKVQKITIEEFEKNFARETISANSFRAIEAAIRELERKGLSLGDYHIVVFRVGTSLFVAFGNPESKDRLPPMGCPGPRRCFSVELHVDDLRVIRSGIY